MENNKIYVVELGKIEAPANATNFEELFDAYDGYAPFSSYNFDDEASALAFFEKAKNDLTISAGASGKQLIEVLELYAINDDVFESIEIAFAKN